MKRLVFCLVGLLVVFPVAAYGLPYTNSGTFLGTAPGNDSEAAVEALLGGLDLEFYAKVDEPALTSGGLTVTYESDKKSGTWDTEDPISYYTLKAGNQFALYGVDPAAGSGTWSTEDLDDKEISHISAWRSVPEPATVLLLGSGLLGLALLGRKLRHRRD